MQENGLRLNLDKTEVLRVGGPEVGGLGDSLTFGGVTLAAKSRVRSLGVRLDPTLAMETQVVSVVRTTFFHLWADCPVAALSRHGGTRYLGPHAHNLKIRPL